MPLSIDLRERVIAAIDSGMRKVDAVKIFKVSRRVIYFWLDLRKNTNSLAAKSGYQKGHSHGITDWDKFRKFINNHKHLSIKRMTIEWQKLFNETITERVIGRGLKKINYTSKKNIWLSRGQ